MTVDVGQDPGKEGWIAWVDSKTGEPVGAIQQPLVGDGKGDTLDRLAMARLVRDLVHNYGIRIWVIELQEPARGAGRNNSSSLGIQMLGYGMWLGILAALEVPTVEVSSNLWRKALGVSKPSYPREKPLTLSATKAQQKEWTTRDRKRQDKQRKEGLQHAIQKAQALYPQVDMRRSSKCKTPSPDKCIAHLLARLATTMHGGGGALGAEKQPKPKKKRARKASPDPTPAEASTSASAVGCGADDPGQGSLFA